MIWRSGNYYIDLHVAEATQEKVVRFLVPDLDRAVAAFGFKRISEDPDPFIQYRREGQFFPYSLSVFQQTGRVALFESEIPCGVTKIISGVYPKNIKQLEELLSMIAFTSL